MSGHVAAYPRRRSPRDLLVNSELQEPYRWKQLRIVPVIEHRRSRNGLPLDSDQVQEIGRRAISEARPTPLGFGPSPNAGEDYEQKLLVAVDRIRLRREAESVVVVLGFPLRARLLYGELRDGAFVPLWDSPLLFTSGGAGLGWSYLDLNDDGRLEIVFRGSAQPYYQTLTIFNIDGEEMTRNKSCPILDTALLDTNPTCPLVGEQIEIKDLDPGEKRPRDIFVYQRESGDNQRLRLKGGVYVPSGRPPEQ